MRTIEEVDRDLNALRVCKCLNCGHARKQERIRKDIRERDAKIEEQGRDMTRLGGACPNPDAPEDIGNLPFAIRAAQFAIYEQYVDVQGHMKAHELFDLLERCRKALTPKETS